MAESTLSINYDTLRQTVGEMLGYPFPVDPTTAQSTWGWSTNQIARVDYIIKSGLRQFYWPPPVQGMPAGYTWRFLRTTAIFTTVASQEAYNMPDNFNFITTPPRFFSFLLGGIANETYQMGDELVQLTFEQYNLMKERVGSLYTGQPKYFIIITLANTMPGGANEYQTSPRWAMGLFPIPDSTVYDIVYEYSVIPNFPTDSGNKIYLPAGAQHANTIEASCRAVAEMYLNNNVQGVEWQNFMRCLTASYNQDIAMPIGEIGGHIDQFSSDVTLRYPTTAHITVGGIVVS